MNLAHDVQPFWENGASVFWVILAVGFSLYMIVAGFKGVGKNKDDE